MIAENVDQARPSARVLMDTLVRFLHEDRLAIGAGDTEAFFDVTAGFRGRELAGFIAQRNSLPKLPEPRIPKLQLQLRLASQNDLQQLLTGSLQVCKQPNFLQQLRA